MSTRTFICQHCHRRVKKNPRLKGEQHYCGQAACQQARKDKWERERCRSDPAYLAKRKLAKKNWHRGYPGDRYQHFYRQEHSDYTKSNRCNQQKRDKKITGNESVPKIVKTDALIVELRACGDFQKMMFSGTG
jgi:hypothetical protein